MVVMIVLAALGAFAFIFGAGVVEGINDLRNKTLEPGEGTELLVCIIVFLCLVLVMSGIRSLRHIQCTLVMNEKTVQMTLSLFGKASGMWSEPLENYEGIQFVLDQVITGKKNAPPRTLAAVVLHHADPHKCIRLCEMEGGDVGRKTSADYAGGGPFRKTCESYAEIFNLPVLEKTLQGKIIRRRIEGLNKPAGKLVCEGEISLNYSPNNPPRGLLIKHRGNTVEVTIRRFMDRSTLKKILVSNLAFSGVMGILFLLLWVGSGPSSPIFLIPIIFGFVFIFVAVATVLQNWQTLILSETRVNITHQTIHISSVDKTGNIIDSKKQPLSSIEEIQVGKYEVLLLGDKGNTALFTPSQTAAEWLRDTLLKEAAAGSETGTAPSHVRKVKDSKHDSHAFVPQMGMLKTKNPDSPAKRIFVSVFMVLWGIGSALAISNSIYAQARSAAWASINGVIKQSKIDNQSRADMAYIYTVAEKEYEGYCVNFHDYHHKEGVLICTRYPVGKKITVYYDPRNPCDSCLEPGLKIQDFFPRPAIFLLTAVFSFIAGCAILIKAIRERLSTHLSTQFHVTDNQRPSSNRT